MKGHLLWKKPAERSIVTAPSPSSFFYQLVFHIDAAPVTISFACIRCKAEQIVGIYASVCMGKFKLRNTFT